MGLDRSRLFLVDSGASMNNCHFAVDSRYVFGKGLIAGAVVEEEIVVDSAAQVIVDVATDRQPKRSAALPLPKIRQFVARLNSLRRFVGRPALR